MTFVYPRLFTFESIVPIDYPFIKMKGPTGCTGVLLVFETEKAYADFCEDEYLTPIRMTERTKP